MANNMTLITKTGGVVTAEIDGALFNSMEWDCRLQGMTFSRSGMVVTISKGNMLICGRFINNTDTTEVTLTGTTNGTIWLIGRIQNNVFSFRQTTSEPTLTQGNINMGSSTYECILLRARVSNGAITTFEYSLPYIYRTGGTIYGTTENPPAGNYGNRTLYIQYED